MNIKKLLESNMTRYVIIGIGCFFVLVLVFRAGMEIGFKEATFSSRLGDNYSRNFIGDRDTGMMGAMRGGMPGGFGATGKVVKVDTSSLVVATKDNLEKTVIVDDDTSVRQYRNTISLKDIKSGDLVVVIGEPNENGEILAKLIRLVTQATTTPITK